MVKMPPVLEQLFRRDLLVISGKGGTGKSLVAATLAVAAARAGKRVLVVETAAQSQLAPLLDGSASLFHQETFLRPGIWGINLQAQECFREYIVKYLGHPRLYDTVFKNQTVTSFINAIPGLGESMMLGRLLYSCRIENPRRFDLLIFDAPASGHFLSMMQTPNTIIEALRIGPLVKELVRVQDFLGDPTSCLCLFVTTSEELVVSETLEFLPQLESHIPLSVGGVVVNKANSRHPLTASESAALTIQHPDMKVVLDYSEACISNAQRLEAELVSHLQSHHPNKTVLRIPDLGLLQEPLTDKAVDELLSLIGLER